MTEGCSTLCRDRGRRASRRLVGVFAILFAAMLSGCTGFERDWRASQQFVNPCDGFSGRWEGSWKSDHNGHRGKLRAIITPTDNEHIYNARFKATYAFVIPYQFEIPMQVTTDEQGVHFEGQADLGWLAGGNYTYTGTAHCGEFDSVYCADKDHGIFSMKRLDACCMEGFYADEPRVDEAAPTAPQE